MLLFIFGVLALVIGRVLPALSQLARLIEVVSTVANSSEREARKKERENEKERKAAKKTLHFLIAFLRSKKETFKREHTLFRSRKRIYSLFSVPTLLSAEIILNLVAVEKMTKSGQIFFLSFKNFLQTLKKIFPISSDRLIIR
jgi:hypothetical protein